MNDYTAQIVIASVALGIIIANWLHARRDKSKIHELNCNTQYKLLKDDILDLHGASGLILLSHYRNNAMDFWNEYKKAESSTVKYKHLMRLCDFKEKQLKGELKNKKEHPFPKG